jgi:hypothetical protein
MAFSVNPIAGLTLDELEPTQTNTGAIVTDNLGRRRRLVSSGAAISPCTTLSITSSNVAAQMTPALAIEAALIGFTPVSVSCSTSGQYFWAILDGPVTIRVAANCQPDVPLYTTDTAGVLDDLTVSLSQYQVMGVEVDSGSSNSAAGASNLPATANNPLVRHPKQSP